MKVLSHFLREEDNNYIENKLVSDEFPWFFTHKTTENPKKSFFATDISLFQHTFYHEGELNSTHRDIIDIFRTSFIKNDIDFDRYIKRMLANLVLPKLEIRHTPFHTDQKVDHMVAIYYVNAVGGKTVFKEGHKVVPQRNKCIVFDGSREHCHHLPLYKSRLVFNFNFY